MNDILESVVLPTANKLLIRADLPQDKEKAENQKTVFLDALREMNYDFDNTGTIRVLDDQGFPLQDEYGYNVEIQDYVKQTFDKFFNVSDMPLNEREYIQQLKDPGITPERRILLTNYWRKKQR